MGIDVWIVETVDGDKITYTVKGNLVYDPIDCCYVYNLETKIISISNVLHNVQKTEESS